MRIISFFVIILFSSCGIAPLKREKFLRSRGYDTNNDTSIIKPYEYYIKQKGYTAVYRELTDTNRLNIKIGILGFENADSIPSERLYVPMTFVLSDSSYIVENGELRFSRNGFGHFFRFGRKYGDTCLCNSSFGFVKKKARTIGKKDILFFWNVRVSKNGTNYLIPSRKYFIK